MTKEQKKFIKKIVDEFLETEFLDIRQFLKQKRIIYTEIIFEHIINELTERVLGNKDKSGEAPMTKLNTSPTEE